MGEQNSQHRSHQGGVQEEHRGPEVLGKFYFKPVQEPVAMRGDMGLTKQRSKLPGAWAGVVAGHCVLASLPCTINHP